MIIVANIEYDQGHEIGRGQYGKVYHSTDPQVSGILAVKVIPKTKLLNPANFWAESQAMHKAAHDNVVPVKYACQTTDNIILAMPYYEKGSLASRISLNPLSPLEAVRIGLGILSGITQIHNAGHVHYDIKPSNVLFSDQDKPLVSDFGQAMALDSTGIAPSPVEIYSAGTPPELITHRQGTRESDIYQAGLTLYRAVNGDPYFKAQLPATLAELHLNIASGRFPNRVFLPHVPKALRTVLRTALQVEVGKRFNNTTEFANSLGRVNPRHNWETFNYSNGAMEWKCPGGSGNELVVRLDQSGRQWDSTAESRKNGKCRSVKKSMCRKGVTHLQALEHLKRVFEELEQA